MSNPAHTHPVLACADVIEAALKDVADVDPVFMTTEDKATALLRLGALASQVEAMGLRILAVADDVADRGGAQDPGVWLSHKGLLDRGVARRSQRLAEALDRRWFEVGAATLDGRVNLAQAEVIVRALDALPGDIDAGVRARAEQHLLHEAASFGPRSLRVLGRRVLDVVAPEVAEEAAGKALERRARRPRSRSCGPGAEATAPLSSASGSPTRSPTVS